MSITDEQTVDPDEPREPMLELDDSDRPAEHPDDVAANARRAERLDIERRCRALLDGIQAATREEQLKAQLEHVRGQRDALLVAARNAQAAIASNDSQRELALRQAKEQLDAAIASVRGGES